MDCKSDILCELVSSISPLDSLEAEHIQDALAWIKSGEPLFRINERTLPPRHLVSYFILFDESASKVLLVDHKKAKRYIPAGGHVEPNENPKETIRRECMEELGVVADFWREDPIFLTIAKLCDHTDVCLWYVLRGNSTQQYVFDPGEFNGIKWFPLNALPPDPNVKRGIEKLIKIQKTI